MKKDLNNNIILKIIMEDKIFYTIVSVVFYIFGFLSIISAIPTTNNYAVDLGVIKVLSVSSLSIVRIIVGIVLIYVGEMSRRRIH